tara:strand:+ start:80 stop:1318 length:1239 start_codon:yes stop_codon:yes gene_type:complete
MADADIVYDWEADRDRNGISLQEANRITTQHLSQSCKCLRWLKATEDSFFVNKVFLLELVVTGPEQKEMVVLKLMHPFWNFTGKCINEVNALQYFAKSNVPAPTVLGYYSNPVTLPKGSDEEKEKKRKEVMDTDADKKEWILMEYVPGECLAAVWDDMRWEERKGWIGKIVKELCKVKKESFGEVTAQDFFLHSKDRYSEWTEYPLFLCSRILETISTIEGTNNPERPAKWYGCGQSELGKWHEQLTRLQKVIAREQRFKSIPIVFCSCDVAPKNIIVQRSGGEKRITALLDLEWAGPAFFGHDIAEMIYPLEDPSGSANESFTDSLEVPFEEQREYVLGCWIRECEWWSEEVVRGFAERDNMKSVLENVYSSLKETVMKDENASESREVSRLEREKEYARITKLLDCYTSL